MDEIVIGNGLAEVAVNTAGGAITGYRTGGPEAWYDWFVNDPGTHPGCFPMVPFCSRIGYGRFTFGRREIILTANNPPEPHAIHGHGFQRQWVIEDRSRDSVVLTYLYPPADWPWRYQARQIIRLCDKDLTLELQVRNLSDENMPAGLGIHPFFPRTPQMRVTAKVSGLWRLDANLLGRDLQPVPRDLDPGRGLSVHNAVLDHVFHAWSGTARLYWPERDASLTLTSSAEHSNLIVYAPDGADFICVEPVSNAPDGFNMALQSVPRAYEILAPGQIARRSWTLQPRCTPS